MWFHVLACDYDRTLATDGRIAAETMEAVRALRTTGRRVILVTGRGFDDVRLVCPDLDLFDLVVAENGAVLYEPGTTRVEYLVAPPPPALVAELEHRGVPITRGRVIVATVTPYEAVVLEVIRTLGLELEIVFNREAVMILPAEVSKASGLRAAVRRLGISPHNVVAVGDAENDHTFLACAGFGVAVANAVPALVAHADWVTTMANGAGIRELVMGLLRDDLASLRERFLTRTIELGTRMDGTPFLYPVRGPNVLVTGASGSGESTLAGVFVERLVRDEYVVCLLDPEGNYRPLADQEGVIVLTSEPGTVEARAAEAARLVRHRSTSVAIDLSHLDREEKVRAAAVFLHAIQRLRAETGAPHWVVIDEAHHLFPPVVSVAEEAFDFEWSGVCLVTNEPGLLAGEVLDVAGHVFSTSVEAVMERLRLLPPDAVPSPLPPGEALSIPLLDGRPRPVERFRVARRETQHQRHVRKHATGRLPLDRAFHFRGPDGALDLVAQNLETFTQLARGVDARTWLHHLRNGDVTRWLREQMKDPELAEEAHALEGRNDAEETRRAVLNAIARRYTSTATVEE